MIHELLKTGGSEPITGRELAKLLDCDIRTITQQIANERKRGLPICASQDTDNPGYYLAADAEQLEAYCDQLQHRENELYKIRTALRHAAQQMPGGQQMLNID